MSLHSFAKQSGVLPSYLINDDDKVVEIICCDSISGGAEYEYDMPKYLSLIRRFEDGREFRMKYQQVKENTK